MSGWMGIRRCFFFGCGTISFTRPLYTQPWQAFGKVSYSLLQENSADSALLSDLSGEMERHWNKENQDRVRSPMFATDDLRREYESARSIGCKELGSEGAFYHRPQWPVPQFRFGTFGSTAARSLASAESQEFGSQNDASYCLRTVRTLPPNWNDFPVV